MALTFDEYQRIAFETAVYPECGSGSKLALAYVALGLGESGEAQGKIKKFLRGDYGDTLTEEMRYAILDECFDLVWYVGALTKELGFDMNEGAGRNIAKLRSRKERGVLMGSGDER